MDEFIIDSTQYQKDTEYIDGRYESVKSLFFLIKLEAPRGTRGNINSSPPWQNGLRFADDILRCIFVNEKFRILMKLLLKFVPMGPFDSNPALVQIMAWHRIGDTPLSEPMLTRITDPYMRH